MTAESKIKQFIIKAAARKPLSNKELAKVIAAVRQGFQNKAKSMTGSNPQVVELRKKNEALADFAYAVEKALNGDMIDLNLYKE